MGAKMRGNRRKADNDNQPKGRSERLDEIPIPHDEYRTAPVVEKVVGKGWFCLVTIPQAEYRCADALSAGGVATYVPTHTYWERRRKGRDLYNTELQAPLFRGYVFACLSRPEFHDDPYGRQVVLRPDWGPIFERDAFNRSRVGVLSFLGNQGRPVPMALRHINAEGKDVGLAALAAEEREGFFDVRRRRRAEAERAKQQARDAAEAKRAERMLLPVIAGDEVTPRVGPFSGHVFVAENDNDEQGMVRIGRELFGRVTLTTISIDDLDNLSRPQTKNGEHLRRA